MIETSIMKKLNINEGSKNSSNGRTFLSKTEKNTPLAFERVFIVSYYNMEIKVSFFTNSLILAIDKITISDKITTSNLQTHIN